MNLARIAVLDGRSLTGGQRQNRERRRRKVSAVPSDEDEKEALFYFPRRDFANFCQDARFS